MLTKVVHNNTTQYAVARSVGHSLEYVRSASGRVSSFKTLPAAKVALRAAIAKATGEQA
jgi:hypothetical protein